MKRLAIAIASVVALLTAGAAALVLLEYLEERELAKSAGTSAA